MTSKKPKHEEQNFAADWWTLRQAASHFGMTTGTIRRYIRDGLPSKTAKLGKLTMTVVRPRELGRWKAQQEANLAKTLMVRRSR